MTDDNHDRSSFLSAADASIVHQGNAIADDDDGGDDNLHEIICQNSCTSIATTESTEVMNLHSLHGETDHARLSQSMKKKRQEPDDDELERARKRQHCGDTVKV